MINSLVKFVVHTFACLYLRTVKRKNQIGKTIIETGNSLKRALEKIIAVPQVALSMASSRFMSLITPLLIALFLLPQVSARSSTEGTYVTPTIPAYPLQSDMNAVERAFFDAVVSVLEGLVIALTSVSVILGELVSEFLFRTPLPKEAPGIFQDEEGENQPGEGFLNEIFHFGSNDVEGLDYGLAGIAEIIQVLAIGIITVYAFVYIFGSAMDYFSGQDRGRVLVLFIIAISGVTISQTLVAWLYEFIHVTTITIMPNVSAAVIDSLIAQIEVFIQLIEDDQIDQIVSDSVVERMGEQVAGVVLFFAALSLAGFFLILYSLAMVALVIFLVLRLLAVYVLYATADLLIVLMVLKYAPGNFLAGYSERLFGTMLSYVIGILPMAVIMQVGAVVAVSVAGATAEMGLAFAIGGFFLSLATVMAAVYFGVSTTRASGAILNKVKLGAGVIAVGATAALTGGGTVAAVAKGSLYGGPKGAATMGAADGFSRYLRNKSEQGEANAIQKLANKAFSDGKNPFGPDGDEDQDDQKGKASQEQSADNDRNPLGRGEDDELDPEDAAQSGKTEEELREEVYGEEPLEDEFEFEEPQDLEPETGGEDAYDGVPESPLSSSYADTRPGEDGVSDKKKLKSEGANQPDQLHDDVPMEGEIGDGEIGVMDKHGRGVDEAVVPEDEFEDEYIRGDGIKTTTDEEGNLVLEASTSDTLNSVQKALEEDGVNITPQEAEDGHRQLKIDRSDFGKSYGVINSEAYGKSYSLGVDKEAQQVLHGPQDRPTPEVRLIDMDVADERFDLEDAQNEARLGVVEQAETEEKEELASVLRTHSGQMDSDQMRAQAEQLKLKAKSASSETRATELSNKAAKMSTAANQLETLSDKSKIKSYNTISNSVENDGHMMVAKPENVPEGWASDLSLDQGSYNETLGGHVLNFKDVENMAYSDRATSGKINFTGSLGGQKVAGTHLPGEVEGLETVEINSGFVGGAPSSLGEISDMDPDELAQDVSTVRVDNGEVVEVTESTSPREKTVGIHTGRVKMDSGKIVTDASEYTVNTEGLSQEDFNSVNAVMEEIGASPDLQTQDGQTVEWGVETASQLEELEQRLISEGINYQPDRGSITKLPTASSQATVTRQQVGAGDKIRFVPTGLGSVYTTTSKDYVEDDFAVSIDPETGTHHVDIPRGVSSERVAELAEGLFPNDYVDEIRSGDRIGLEFGNRANAQTFISRAAKEQGVTIDAPDAKAMGLASNVTSSGGQTFDVDLGTLYSEMGGSTGGGVTIESVGNASSVRLEDSNSSSHDVAFVSNGNEVHAATTPDKSELIAKALGSEMAGGKPQEFVEFNVAGVDESALSEVESELSRRVRSTIESTPAVESTGSTNKRLRVDATDRDKVRRILRESDNVAKIAAEDSYVATKVDVSSERDLMEAVARVKNVGGTHHITPQTLDDLGVRAEDFRTNVTVNEGEYVLRKSPSKSPNDNPLESINAKALDEEMPSTIDVIIDQAGESSSVGTVTVNDHLDAREIAEKIGARVNNSQSGQEITIEGSPDEILQRISSSDIQAAISPALLDGESTTRKTSNREASFTDMLSAHEANGFFGTPD